MRRLQFTVFYLFRGTERRRNAAPAAASISTAAEGSGTGSGAVAVNAAVNAEDTSGAAFGVQTMLISLEY